MSIPQDDLAAFESPKLLIESAKESLINFEQTCDTFIQSCTYEVIRKHDPQTGEEVINLRLRQRMPGKIRTLASAIISDLRHALDQALCDGARLLGTRNISRIHFPFGKEPKDFENEIKRRCGDIDADLVNFLRGFKPYLGGDNLLWALSRMAAPNKHQRILHISMKDAGTILQSEGLYCRGPFTVGINKWNDMRNELEFARIGQGGYVQMDFAIPLQIIVATAEAVAGHEALPLFNTLTGKVEGIVLGLEAETARILSARS